LYWGVRARRDLYAHSELEELARCHPHFSYRPVLSEPGAAWTGLTGWVHEAVCRDSARGSTAPLHIPDIYASGPPAMIQAVNREFIRDGADPARLWVDSFDYAKDPQGLNLATVSTTASTKS
jgi:CDP-4-dehydro-6-deoxyglucose reductase